MNYGTEPDWLVRFLKHSTDCDSQERDAAWREEFKLRTGHDYPTSRAGWEDLMVLAGFTDKQIVDAGKGNWCGYSDDPEASGFPTPWATCNASFVKRIVLQLEQRRTKGESSREVAKVQRGRPSKSDRDDEALRLHQEGRSYDEIFDLMKGQFSSQKALRTAVRRKRIAQEKPQK